MGHMMMRTSCMCNYYLCGFLEIINNETKIEESVMTDDDVYILHVKRYVIRTCSRLER
jgi:hypothetical protein